MIKKKTPIHKSGTDVRAGTSLHIRTRDRRYIAKTDRPGSTHVHANRVHLLTGGRNEEGGAVFAPATSPAHIGGKSGGRVSSDRRRP